MGEGMDGGSLKPRGAVSSGVAGEWEVDARHDCLHTVRKIKDRWKFTLISQRSNGPYMFVHSGVTSCVFMQG